MNIRTVLEPDAIPSIDDPRFGEEYLGEDDDEVLVIQGAPPRAYPLRILTFHEIVNDVVDDTPLAVTWCPLCASAVVYERTVEGTVLTFGVSGKLADDDLVMYDRETGSEWKQSLGECIAGELVGAELTIHPATIVTWTAFRDAHPDGIVLQPEQAESEAASDTDEPAPIDYDMSPYESYFESHEFGLAAHRGEDSTRSWDRSDIDPKTIVIGIERGGEALAIPRPVVEAAGGTITVTIDGDRLLILVVDGQLHAIEHPGFELDVTEEGIVGDGTTWEVVTATAADGRTLERVPARRLYAFTWQDDHGADAFYLPDE